MTLIGGLAWLVWVRAVCLYDNCYLVMAFCKSQRQLDLSANYNPPPNYYQHQTNPALDPDEVHSSFARQSRFKGQKVDPLPGPGYYYKPLKNTGRAPKMTAPRQSQMPGDEIKINSIPSIPKQSISRAYQQLAPGILVLHEAQQLSGNVGPGSYDPVYPEKKGGCFKFSTNPEKRFGHDSEELEPAKQLPARRPEHPKINVRQALRQPDRKILTPGDLCLELIILRERQLKAEEIPPPGYYHNQKLTSGFVAEEKPKEFQLLAGKARRFQGEKFQTAGPGHYELVSVQKLTEGGYIPKARRTRDLFNEYKSTPGPGAYLVPQRQQQPSQNLSKHPPIFSSGCVRFPHQKRQNSMPGPGQYNVQRPRKFRRLRAVVVPIESRTAKPASRSQTFNHDLMSITDNSSRKHIFSKDLNKGSSCFTSNIKRFKDTECSDVGPGLYDLSRQPRTKFNRKQGVLEREERFRNDTSRNGIGPGYYHVNDQQTKPKKSNDIIL